jgi:hypothetical protein
MEATWGSPLAQDLTIKGPSAMPDRGMGASFGSRGDIQGASTRESIQRIFQSNLTRAEQYRITFEPDWLASYVQYHGAGEDAGKAPWQSQVHVPMSAQAVDLATSRIVSVIFQSDDWFSTKSRARNLDSRSERAKKMVLWQMDKGQAEDPIAQSIKDAMICGNGILKIHVATEVEETVDTVWKPNPPADLLGVPIDMGGKWQFENKREESKRMRFESLIPTDFWLDPSGLNRWCIQRIKRSLSDVWAMAENQYGDDGKTIIRRAVYDSEIVKMVTPGARDTRLDNMAATIRNERVPAVGDTTVDVYEFWGDLVDPANGVTLYKNIFATFINKQYCVRMPERNPFLHKKAPFVLFRGKLLPHQIYGYGLLQQNLKLQDEMDRLLRLLCDKVHLSIPMVEVKDRKLRNPEQIMGDNLRVAPGKIWKVKDTPGDDTPAFTPVNAFQPPNEWEIQLYQLVQTAFQLTGQNNEFASGQTMTTNRKTKEEVESRTSAAQQNFNDAAQYLERTALTPMVNMVYQDMVQFEDDYTAPELMEQFSDNPQDQMVLQQLTDMPLAQRWKEMQLDTEFEVNGVTRDISRQQLLQRVQGFTASVQNDQTLAMLIDKRWELRQLLQAFDFGPEAVLPNADAMLQAQETAALSQTQNPQPQPGMGGMAPGGTPAQGMPGVPGQGAMGMNPHNSRAAVGAQARRPPAA